MTRSPSSSAVRPQPGHFGLFTGRKGLVTGVGAIIHVASPLVSVATPQVILESAVSGTARVLDATLAVGVKRLIITASVVSLVSPDDLWKEITITEVTEKYDQRRAPTRGNRSSRLLVSKALANRAVRDFERAHSKLNLMTIHSSCVYGPLGSGQVYSAPGAGTNRFVYVLLTGAPGPLERVRSRAPRPAAERRRVARARARAHGPPLRRSRSSSPRARYLLRVEKEHTTVAQVK